MMKMKTFLSVICEKRGEVEGGWQCWWEGVSIRKVNIKLNSNSTQVSLLFFWIHIVDEPLIG